MEAIKIQGKVINLGNTIEVGEKKFKKREIVIILDADSQYPQEIALQGTRDLCDKMDDLVIGTEVLFHINLNGRKWTNKEGIYQWFNSLQIWKFEVITSVSFVDNEPAF
ncbi:MAG: DUF3127 domain-containing protein [Oligoflexus sp.]|nr:DUF3127 domain-containing protein [Pseudopedobacter sp.]